MRKLVGIAGFLALGLSPSFMDWRQGNGRDREKIVAYYVVALALIYFGVMKG